MKDNDALLAEILVKKQQVGMPIRIKKLLDEEQAACLESLRKDLVQRPGISRDLSCDDLFRRRHPTNPVPLSGGVTWQGVLR